MSDQKSILEEVSLRDLEQRVEFSCCGGGGGGGGGGSDGGGGDDDGNPCTGPNGPIPNCNIP